MRRTLIIILLFWASIAGCGGDGTAEPVNSIKIESVHSVPGPHGATTYAINVSYDLQTADSAAIGHCFNCLFTDRWGGGPVPITSSPGMTVYRGVGTVTITDTAALTQPATLYVFLVPDQTTDPALVAIDEQTISFP